MDCRRNIESWEAECYQCTILDQKNVVFPQLQNQTWFNKGYNRDGVLIKDGDSFFYICDSYPGLSDEKKKAGVFNGP